MQTRTRTTRSGATACSSRNRSLARQAPVLIALCALGAPSKAQLQLDELTGAPQESDFGVSVASAGDVDGDGFEDVIVGAPEEDSNGSNAGRVRIFSGATGELLWALSGEVNERMGSAVDTAGDLDGDGRSEVILGLRTGHVGLGFPGRVLVVSPSTGTVFHEWLGTHPWASPFADPNFGKSVACIGDVSGDGVQDFAIGAPHDSSATSFQTGSVQVFSGASGLLLYDIYSDSGAHNLGWDVAAAGDVDGDGVGDIVAGSPRYSFDPAGPGLARVYSGATGAVIHTFEGTSVGDKFGESVAGLGDVNGDGHGEILVGAQADSTGGSVSVFDGLTGTLLAKILGDIPGGLFGHSVARLGDSDGDGIAEFIAGASRANVNGAVANGLVRVYSGATFAPLFTLLGAGPGGGGENLGEAVAGISNVNGDGVPDFIIGGWEFVRVYSGNDTGSAAWVEQGSALAGVTGEPALVGKGTLLSGSYNALALSNAAPAAASVLVVGSSSTPIPFLGGTLLTLPDVAAIVLVTDGAGAAALGFDLPRSYPSGAQLWAQCAIADATGPLGASLSNGVLGVTP